MGKISKSYRFEPETINKLAELKEAIQKDINKKNIIKLKLSDSDIISMIIAEYHEKLKRPNSGSSYYR